jgi:hypothetical protein
MKNIVLVWVILLGFFAFSIGAMAQESSDYLVYDWEYRPEAGINKVEIADLNNDGLLELIASSREGVIYDLDEKSKDHVKWQYINLKGNIKTLKVLDFDGDGKKEVIAGSDKQGTSLAVINWQGTDLSSTIDYQSPVNDVAVGDFDGDGVNDLGVASLKTVHALRFTKSSEEDIWDYAANGTVYYVHVFDYNGDGKGEMLYASSWNIDGKDYGDVVMLSSAGKKIWSYAVKGGFPFAAAEFVSSYDINSDGKEEIIVGSKTSGVTVLDGDGNTIWSYQTEKQVNVVQVSTLSGVSGPVLFLGAAPYVYALNAQGSLLWKYAVNTTVYSILVKDADGDSRTEVLVGANKHLHVVSDKGVEIASIDYGKDLSGLNQNFASKNIDVRSIAAGDLKGDNTMEVAVGLSWSESRQDQNYYFGDIVVYEVNKNFVKSGGTATTSTVVGSTSSTVQQTTTTQKRETTSSTATTSATTTSTIPSGGGNNNTTLIILGLIIAGGVILIIVAAILYVVLVKNKRQ